MGSRFLVEAAVRHVHPTARDDIRGDLTVALLFDEVAADDARAATGWLVTAWRRQTNRRDVSFEAERGEGGKTFGGLVTDSASYVPSGVDVIRTGW